MEVTQVKKSEAYPQCHCQHLAVMQVLLPAQPAGVGSKRLPWRQNHTSARDTQPLVTALPTQPSLPAAAVRAPCTRQANRISRGTVCSAAAVEVLPETLLGKGCPGAMYGDGQVAKVGVLGVWWPACMRVHSPSVLRCQKGQAMALLAHGLHACVQVPVSRIRNFCIIAHIGRFVPTFPSLSLSQHFKRQAQVLANQAISVSVTD